MSVRKLILDKQLVLPNTISFPPSLVRFSVFLLRVFLKQEAAKIALHRVMLCRLQKLIQTVDMLIEHDPDHPLSKVITRMFGEERPKLNEAEKKERQTLKVRKSLKITLILAAL